MLDRGSGRIENRGLKNKYFVTFKYVVNVYILLKNLLVLKDNKLNELAISCIHEKSRWNAAL